MDRRFGRKEVVSALVDDGFLLDKQDNYEDLHNNILFVSDLHYWTTDAQLEREMYKYGTIKEVRYYGEKDNGKSKGYCKVEFKDPAAATACKEGMNGHVFSGKSCTISFEPPESLRRPVVAQSAAQSNIRGNVEAMEHRQPVEWPRNNQPPWMHQERMMGHGFNPAYRGFPAAPHSHNGARVPNVHINPAYYGSGMPGIEGHGFNPAYIGFPAAPHSHHGGIVPNVQINPAYYGRGMPGIEGHGFYPAYIGFPAAPHSHHGGRVPNVQINPAYYGRGMHGIVNPSVYGNVMSYTRPIALAPSSGGTRRFMEGESNYRREVVSGHGHGETRQDKCGYREDRRHDDTRRRDGDGDHGWSQRRHHDDVRETNRNRYRDRETSPYRDRDRHRDWRHSHGHDGARETSSNRDRYRESDGDRYSTTDRPRRRDTDLFEGSHEGRSVGSSSHSKPHEEERQSMSRCGDEYRENQQ